MAGCWRSRGEGLGERIRRRPLPFALHDIALRDASPNELAQLSDRMGLALSIDEMVRIQTHFEGLGRDPTEVELQSLGQAWSEHCCYKSSKVFLKEFIFPVQAPYVIDRGDAGVVEFDEDHAYALRIESHNHPSAIEPYGGANTGIGGILRDVLAMGAQPIALADPLHFGPLDYPMEKLPRGTKHPKYLFGGVVAGIRDYGHRVGVPTLAGCIVLDEGYAGNRVAEVDLEKVPLKEEGLGPWEIWVSESQERMMLAVRPENVDSVLKIFDLYDVPATVIGRVIPEKVCRVRYQGTVVLEMDLPFYTGGPEYSRPYEAPAALPSQDLRLPREPQDYRSTILKILASPNVASKEYVIRQYDHEVRASTVLKPLQGVIGKAAHGDASVIRPLVDSWRALAISVASTPHFTAIDPYRGGATAVDEVCRNLVAVGANPHSLTNCLNFGNPEKPDRLWYFREAVRGIGATAQELGVPIPSGNVSFYNESARGPCPPTPVALGVGIVEDLRQCVTSDFKRERDPVVLVGSTQAELGGSEYLRLRGGTAPVPSVDPMGLRASMDHLLRAIRAGTVAATHDLSHGGLAVAAAEMCLGGDIEADLKTTAMDPMRWDVQLFSESNGRWLVEIPKDRYEAFTHLMEGIPTPYLGPTGGRSLHLGRGRQWTSLAIPVMRKAWSEAIPNQVVVS